jgi:hypothetical protein
MVAETMIEATSPPTTLRETERVVLHVISIPI